MRKKGGNLKRVKKQNSKLIKEMLYKNPLITRTEIADQLAVSLPTVTTMVNHLLNQGIILEKPDQSLTGELGRKPIPLAFASNYLYVIGVELMPYSTGICIMDLSGLIIAKNKFEVASEDYIQMIEQLSIQIEEVIAESRINHKQILGVGIGLAGIIHAEEGKIYRCGHKEWQEKKLAEDLSRKIDLPVKIENNVRIRAIAMELVGLSRLEESIFGQKIEARSIPENFAYLFVSAGIACSFATNGKVYTGYQTGAGELGHTIVIPDGPLCQICGNRGCLDAIAGERTILKEYMQIQGLNQSSDNEATIKDVLHSFRQKDEKTMEIVYSAVKYIAISLANIINFISPQAVYIDGYIFQEKEIQERILKVTRHNLYGKEEIDISFVPYHSFGGAISAAYYAVQCFFIENPIE